LHEAIRSLTTTAMPVAAMSNDEDRRALRAELEARREEIATMRGVVAALRGPAATRRGKREESPPPRVTTALLIAAFVVGALFGFASALWLVEALRG